MSALDQEQVGTASLTQTLVQDNIQILGDTQGFPPPLASQHPEAQVLFCS